MATDGDSASSCSAEDPPGSSWTTLAERASTGVTGGNAAAVRGSKPSLVAPNEHPAAAGDPPTLPAPQAGAASAAQRQGLLDSALQSGKERKEVLGPQAGPCAIWSPTRILLQSARQHVAAAPMASTALHKASQAVAHTLIVPAPRASDGDTVSRGNAVSASEAHAADTTTSSQKAPCEERRALHAALSNGRVVHASDHSGCKEANASARSPCSVDRSVGVAAATQSGGDVSARGCSEHSTKVGASNGFCSQAGACNGTETSAVSLHSHDDTGRASLEADQHRSEHTAGKSRPPTASLHVSGDAGVRKSASGHDALLQQALQPGSCTECGGTRVDSNLRVSAAAAQRNHKQAVSHGSSLAKTRSEHSASSTGCRTGTSAKSSAPADGAGQGLGMGKHFAGCAPHGNVAFHQPPSEQPKEQNSVQSRHCSPLQMTLPGARHARSGDGPVSPPPHRDSEVHGPSCTGKVISDSAHCIALHNDKPAASAANCAAGASTAAAEMQHPNTTQMSNSRPVASSLFSSVRESPEQDSVQYVAKQQSAAHQDRSTEACGHAPPPTVAQTASSPPNVSVVRAAGVSSMS